MPKFLAVYIGTATEEEKATPVDPKIQEAGMEAWGKWGADNAPAIRDQGGPLGKTKAIDAHGVRDSRNQLVGYLILEAASLEEAAARFKGHPHFAVLRGTKSRW